MSSLNVSRMCSQTLVAWFLCLVAAGSHAQLVRIEVHPVASMTISDQDFLIGRKEGKAVTIAGELRIPRPGTDRLPAVVLVHGSGGVSGFVDDWSQQLNAMGAATFLLDSFTGRGIVSTGNDQSQLGRLAMIFDMYRVLELLARHPRIDQARIATMGFSRGGQAVLYSSLQRFYSMHGPSGGLQFAAYIPFYPTCNTTFGGDGEPADKPIRIFHGSADDYVPVAPCRAYVERLRKAGKDIQLTEYADAHHVFDWPFLKNPVKLPQAQTTKRCSLEEASGGVIINSQTKQPFSYSDPCVERGATIAYHPQAHSDSVKAVKDFVAVVLKPK